MLAIAATAAEPPLPELKTEATDGGSVFLVRNTASQPLTAYLIELVNYPGSYYALWQDEVTGQPLAPGAVKRIPVTNMTVGAAPEYVKLQAAVFADGSTSGAPERAGQIVERRRFVLATTRELIGRIEKGEDTAAVMTGLKEWSDSLPQPTRANRTSQASINNAAARGAIAESVARIEKGTLTQELAELRRLERLMEASRPALR